MKHYHLTIIRNGKYETLFAELSSISAFILIEKELGREVHVIYSRQVDQIEYNHFHNYNICGYLNK